MSISYQNNMQVGPTVIVVPAPAATAATAKPGSPYGEIKPKMRSFDLLLFKGTDVISRAVEAVEKHQDGQAGFTHVGIVLLGKDLLPPVDDAEKKWLHEQTVYVLESTMSGDLADGCRDVHDESHIGVQLRVLDNVVEHYDRPEKSRMAWCPLLQPADGARARAMYEKYRGLSYDMSVIDMAACAFPAVRRIRDNSAFSHVRDGVCRLIYGRKRAGADGKDDNLVSRWQFCSEMVANVYKDLGVLGSSVNASNTMPVDFLPDPNDKTGTKTIDSDGEIPRIVAKPILFHN